MSTTDLGDKEYVEGKRDCIHCGYAMGEREGEPLCDHCGHVRPEQYSGDIDTPKLSDYTSEVVDETVGPDDLKGDPIAANELESPGVPMVETDRQGYGILTTPPQSVMPTPHTAGSMPEIADEGTVHEHVMIPEVKPPLSERVERGIPHSCKEYRDKYSHNAWKTYTIQELGDWVHLFLKRATHRKDKTKARKDVMDAQNYLNMMQSELDAVRKEVS